MLKFEIEQTYSGRFEVHAKDKYFEMKIELPEKKASNQRFLEKQKSKILKTYNRYKEMEKILFSLDGQKNEVKQPKYYLDVFGVFRRFEVEEGLNFHLALNQESNGEPCFHLYYEKYKKKSELWGRTKVATLHYSSNLKQQLEETLSLEWNIYELLQDFKEQLPSVFAKVNYSFEEREPSWQGHDILEESHSWFLGYFTCNGEDIAVVLKKDVDRNLHKVTFVKEYVSSRYYHYFDFKEWFSIPFSFHTDRMASHIIKEIEKENQAQVSEQKKRNFIATIFS